VGLIRNLCALVVLWPGGMALADAPMAVDLSRHNVPVTLGFSGANLVLFGAIEHGGDVVAEVTGPASKTVVSRKERVFGMWVDRDQLSFSGVPSFFWLGSSAPLKSLAPAPEETSHGIGLASLALPVMAATFVDPPTARRYREALIHDEIRRGKYSQEGRVALLGNLLFRAKLHLPGDAPLGRYHVRVFELRDRHVVGQSSTDFIVAREGMTSALYRFSRQAALWYGVFTIALAGLLGWGANMAFRKR
jgi:uncharacterized protein (TIGR02186 family)